jgi:hypothetical protein
MTDQDLKSLSRGMSRDMSPTAIAQRLEIVSDLRDLAMTLATAQRIGTKEQASNASGQDASVRDATPVTE